MRRDLNDENLIIDELLEIIFKDLNDEMEAATEDMNYLIYIIPLIFSETRAHCVAQAILLSSRIPSKCHTPSL